MDSITQHQDLYETWKNQPLAYQLGNIGSEVSRSLKNRRNPSRFKGAYTRAIELFDLTLKAAVEHHNTAASHEIALAKAEFVDYFAENQFRTDPAKMQRYYDQFAILANQH